jgi:RNA polymerase sigma-70 factor (ECF subfamily)
MDVFTATNVVRDPREDAEIPSLVDGIRAGEPAAFERLVERVQTRVRRWARRYTDDEDSAEDVAQEVLIGLERRVQQFRGQSRFTTWLFAVTRSVALNYRRREDRRSELRAERSEAQVATSEEAIPDPDRETLTTLILGYFQALPPQQRKIFQLVDLQGLEPAEVARRLGMRQVTVRANLFKARRTIRMHMLERHERLLTEYRS